MLWSAVKVIIIFGFIAPITLFSSFEIIIIALSTFPSTVWEAVGRI